LWVSVTTVSFNEAKTPEGEDTVSVTAELKPFTKLASITDVALTPMSTGPIVDGFAKRKKSGTGVVTTTVIVGLVLTRLADTALT